MNNLKNIAEGWYNMLLNKVGCPDPVVEEMRLERLEVCRNCLYIGNMCKACGCKLDALLRAPGKACIKGKWDKQ